MNTGDYCPRGRELYEQYIKWHNAYKEWASPKIFQLEKDYYQAYREHVDECAICKEEA